MGLNAFHFPFLIRSIVVEGKEDKLNDVNIFRDILGTSSIQECIPCPPGKRDQLNYLKLTK